MTNAVLKALDAAHRLCALTQGENALTLELGEILERLKNLSPDLMHLVNGVRHIDQEAFGRVSSLFSETPEPDFIQVYVVVEKRVDQSKLHEYDTDIEGHYEILVPSYLSDELQAACALDLFHGSVAIKVLDYFSIVVSKPLESPETYENGTLEILGDFVGITERTAL
jgi:hypothetical protein